MIGMKRIMFLGNLAAAYNRYVLKGVVAYTITHPHLRVFFLDSLNIADIRGLLKSGFHGVIVGSCPLESHLPRWVVESGVPAVDASGQHIFENVLPRVLTDDPATDCSQGQQTYLTCICSTSARPYHEQALYHSLLAAEFRQARPR
ncbi:MAG: hypothetical protein ACP5VQ_03410 [Phycisphaerae bacterium]